MNKSIIQSDEMCINNDGIWHIVNPVLEWSDLG